MRALHLTCRASHSPISYPGLDRLSLPSTCATVRGKGRAGVWELDSSSSLPYSAPRAPSPGSEWLWDSLSPMCQSRSLPGLSASPSPAHSLAEGRGDGVMGNGPVLPGLLPALFSTLHPILAPCPSLAAPSYLPLTCDMGTESTHGGLALWRGHRQNLPLRCELSPCSPASSGPGAHQASLLTCWQASGTAPAIKPIVTPSSTQGCSFLRWERRGTMWGCLYDSELNKGAAVQDPGPPGAWSEGRGSIPLCKLSPRGPGPVGVRGAATAQPGLLGKGTFPSPDLIFRRLQAGTGLDGPWTPGSLTTCAHACPSRHTPPRACILSCCFMPRTPR